MEPMIKQNLYTSAKARSSCCCQYKSWTVMVRLGVASGWAGSRNTPIASWHEYSPWPGDVYHFNRPRAGAEYAHTSQASRREIVELWQRTQEALRATQPLLAAGYGQSLLEAGFGLERVRDGLP